MLLISILDFLKKIRAYFIVLNFCTLTGVGFKEVKTFWRSWSLEPEHAEKHLHCVRGGCGGPAARDLRSGAAQPPLLPWAGGTKCGLNQSLPAVVGWQSGPFYVLHRCVPETRALPPSLWKLFFSASLILFPSCCRRSLFTQPVYFQPERRALSPSCLCRPAVPRACSGSPVSLIS